MNITRQVTVNAPAARVWEVLAHRFHDVDHWASAVDHSATHGAEPAPEDSLLESGGRVCLTQIGRLEEDILAYDEKALHLAYSARGDSMPSFVGDLVNAWTVQPTGPEASSLNVHLRVDLSPIVGTLMTPIMKRQFGSLIDQVLEEFVYFVENGRPHPRKLQAIRAKQADADSPSALEAALNPV